MISATDPVKVLTVPASIIPEVLPSSVFNNDAVIDVSVIVTASLPRKLIPFEE